MHGIVEVIYNNTLTLSPAIRAFCVSLNRMDKNNEIPVQSMETSNARKIKKNE